MKGAFAAAIYDLHRSRVQVLPLAFADALLSAIRAGRRLSCIDDEFILELARRGFVADGAYDDVIRPFSADARSSNYPIIRTISIDVSEDLSAENLVKLSRFISEGVSLGLVSVVLGGSVAAAPAAELLVGSVRRGHPHLLFELITPLSADGSDPFIRSLQIEDGLAAPAEVEPAFGERPKLARPGAQLTASRLIVDGAYFQHLHLLGESAGCLHIDASLNVFPDISERHYIIGNLIDWDYSLARILEDERLNFYWRFGKDRRQKCRDCVYRYACPNPLSMRSSPTDLASAPINCTLDIETTNWITCDP